MMLLVAYAAFVVLFVITGAGAWYLEQQRHRELLMREALETSRRLEESLERRLNEMDEYRHDLADLLQSLDIEQVREADGQDA